MRRTICENNRESALQVQYVSPHPKLEEEELDHQLLFFFFNLLFYFPSPYFAALQPGQGGKRDLKTSIVQQDPLYTHPKKEQKAWFTRFLGLLPPFDQYGAESSPL